MFTSTMITAVTTPSSSSAVMCVGASVDFDLRRCVCGEVVLRHHDGGHERCSRWLTPRTHAVAVVFRRCAAAGSLHARTLVPAHIDTAVTTPSSVVMCVSASVDVATRQLDSGRTVTSGAAGSPRARTHTDVHIDNDHCRHHSIVVVCCHVCRCVCGSRRVSMCLWRAAASRQ